MSQVFWKVILCLAIILDVPQGQQEALTHQHNVTYQMPESSATPLPKLHVSKAQETFLAVHRTVQNAISYNTQVHAICLKN